jgi:hypothetical protein
VSLRVQLSVIRALISAFIRVALSIFRVSSFDPMTLRLPTIALTALLILGSQSANLSAATPAAAPNWIWLAQDAAPNQELYFRKTFMANKADSVRLYATCDNELTVFLNGQEVLSGKAWEKVQFKDVTGLVKMGANTIAVKGKNNDGNKAGLLVKLVL